MALEMLGGYGLLQWQMLGIRRKTGDRRDMGDARLTSSAAEGTVSFRFFICSSVPEIVPSVD